LPRDSVAAVDNRPVYLLHAPNELTIDVPAGAERMIAEIGLLPGAYTNGGNSDGVSYTIFTQRPGSPRQQIWSRHLDPIRNPGDRGPVQINVPLPAPEAGIQIVFATAVGPNGDRGWDQSYVAQVRFE
jgi:hypothetical protein